MNTTIEVMRMVDVMPWLDQRPGQPAMQRRPAPCAPTAPMAPASVGVARPRPMVPSTRKISTMEGIMPHRHPADQFPVIGSRSLSGIGGIALRRMNDSSTM